MVRSFVLLVFIAAASMACRRATPEQCDKLCMKYNELGFWDRFEKDSAALAPEARDKLRAERQKEWEGMVARDFDPGRENCVKECRKAAKPDDIKCVEAAKTLADARACLD